MRQFSNRPQMTSKCGKNKKVAHKPQASVSPMSPPHFDVFCDLLERLSIAFTANVNLYHLSKFSIYLSYTVHCNYTKIGKLTPILSIRIVLSCFYLLISHSENFSTWISNYPSALNAMLNLSITEQTHNNMESICFIYKGNKCSGDRLRLLEFRFFCETLFNPSSSSCFSYLSTAGRIIISSVAGFRAKTF